MYVLTVRKIYACVHMFHLTRFTIETNAPLNYLNSQLMPKYSQFDSRSYTRSFRFSISHFLVVSVRFRKTCNVSCLHWERLAYRSTVTQITFLGGARDKLMLNMNSINLL